MVIYASVVSIPIRMFPPVDIPTYTDLLVLGVLLILLMRIAITYRFASLVKENNPFMLLLVFCIALIFAWQFRLLAAAREPNVTGPLSTYYALHVLLVFTMPAWRRLAGEQVSSLLQTPMFIQTLQVIGILAALIGLLFEYLHPLHPFREFARWSVAVVLLYLAVIYAFSKPWERVKLVEAPSPAAESA